MHLVRVGKQVIVEEDSAQPGVGKEAFDQRLISSCTRNVVPSVCGAVGDNRIKFYQVYVMSHNICQRFHLEGTFFQALRQEIGEAELNTVSGIGPYDKRLYFFIGLGDLRGKITQRPFADAFCVFFQHIQEPVWIMVPIFVVNNGNLNCLDLVIAGLVRIGIIAKLHVPVLLSGLFCFQDTDIVVGFPEHMVCQKRQDNGGNLSA